MITITPQGSVYLCKTPLENDYKNQLTFSNATTQLNYFTSKVVTSETDYTYMKKDNQIIVGKPIDTIIDCNYLFYKNTGFTNKYYYCFITDMEYVNENATRITIEVDVYQTYMFDIITKKCYVEREHVNDDTLGKNTVPEGFETGEFIINNIEYFDEYATEYMIVIGVTKPLSEILDNDTTTIDSGKVYNGVFSGLYYYTFETPQYATRFLICMDGQGIGDAVYDVFLIPKSLYPASTVTWTTKSCAFNINYSTSSFTFTWDIKYAQIPTTQKETYIKQNKTITLNSSLNGYTPKNNKMFTKEFNYMYVTNNGGDDITYNYEDFYNNSPTFNVVGAITPGCSIRLVPQNYKLYEQVNSETNVLNPYGLNGAKYPTCSWTSDSYTNWLTQQANNIQWTNFGNALSTVISGAGLIMGNPTGLLGLTGNIENMIQTDMAIKEKREFTPSQSKGNSNTGDVTFAMGYNQFVLYQMSVKYEFAKRIDDYLSAYGYKVNEFKIPNLSGRTNWNYVKTIGCNFEGDIPQMYLNKIKEIFNNGVTLWHDPTKFLDYSQSNSIVS